MTKNEDIKKEEAGKISIKEGSAWSLMEGFGNKYITPYALSIGATNTQIGILSSLPGLLGNILQIPVLHLIRKNSRKKVVFIACLFQALMWIPIISIGFLYFFNYINSRIASNLLIIIYSLLIIAGSTANPAWNSWMKDILKTNIGEYFGKRSRIINFVVTLSMLSAGIILNFFGKEYAFKGFLIIFLIAFAGRMISAYLVTRQYEPKFNYENKDYFSLRQFIKKMFFNNFGHFVIYISLISFATAIAGPFFAVYMLKDLNFSYIEYTLVSLSSILTIIIFMPFWGKFADKFGNIKVIKITGFFVPLVPVFWLASSLIQKTNPLFPIIYLMIIEGFSGFAWSGFNLSANNFVYDAVSREKMVFCFTYFNIINAFGTFIGAYAGGFIASQNILIFGMKSILIIFLISAGLRFLISLKMISFLKEVREVHNFDFKKSFKNKVKEEKIKLKNLRIDLLNPIGRHLKF